MDILQCEKVINEEEFLKIIRNQNNEFINFKVDKSILCSSKSVTSRLKLIYTNEVGASVADSMGANLGHAPPKEMKLR
jgi:hypothetical protein